MQNYLFDSVGFKPQLNEVKPPADATDFLEVIYRASSIKIRAQIRRGEFDNVLYFDTVTVRDLFTTINDDIKGEIFNAKYSICIRS
jgi:hypothetical protein